MLYYHRVNATPRRLLGLVSQELSVSPAAFARQLAYLRRRRFVPLSAADVEAHLESGRPFPAKALLITFDDGYADNYTEALPLLRAAGIPALVFLPTDFVGRAEPFPWDPGGLAEASRPLTWNEVRAMARAGIAFGSHSRSHARLDTLPAAALDAELVESRAVIERETGERVAFLAYPAGDFSAPVQDAARRAGYAGSFTTIPGSNDPGVDRFALRRVEVSASDPLPVFALKLAGALDVLSFKESAGPRRLRAWLNRWLMARWGRR